MFQRSIPSSKPVCVNFFFKDLHREGKGFPIRQEFHSQRPFGFISGGEDENPMLSGHITFKIGAWLTDDLEANADGEALHCAFS